MTHVTDLDATADAVDLYGEHCRLVVEEGERLPLSMLDKIVTGDNVRLMRRCIPDNSIDLTVTSPPYDNLRTYDGYSWDFEAVAAELWRVTKPGGVVVWVVGDATIDGSETGTSFRQALHFMGLGFRLHDTMIYERTGKPLTHNRYEQGFEYMFVLSKGRPACFNPILVPKKYVDNRKIKNGGREADGSFKVGFSAPWKKKTIKANVWKYPTGGGLSATDKAAHKHPAIFPESLARDHILSWSQLSNVVLDPFVGSGTVAKMALATGRHFIGIDISEKYCRIARRRVAEQREKMADTWQRGNGIPGQPVDTADLPLWSIAQ